MKVAGTHQGRKVEIEFKRKEAIELLVRATKTKEQALTKGNKKMASMFSKVAQNWDKILRDGGDNIEEFPREKQEYIDHSCFSEAGWKRMFGA